MACQVKIVYRAKSATNSMPAGKSGLQPCALGVLEIDLARLAVDGARLEVAILDARAGEHLGVVARREHLVRREHLGEGDAPLLPLDPRLAQELDDALAGDAVEEAAIGDRRVGGAILHD